MPPRVVLFDLDDTLTPRRESVRRFARRFASDFAARLETGGESALEDALIASDLDGYNPRRGEDLASGLAWSSPAPTAAELEDYWQRTFAYSVVPRAGVADLLDELRISGVLLGVVTNGGVFAQQTKLECMDLARRMDSIVISEAVGCKKPDPRIFELALEQVRARPEEAWFVGDHPENDVLGAQSAGLEAVWVRTGYNVWPEGREEPCRQIDGFAELASMLRGSN